MSNYFKLGKDIHSIIFGYFIEEEYKTKKRQVLIEIENHEFHGLYRGEIRQYCEDLGFRVSKDHLFNLLFYEEIYWTHFTYNIKNWKWVHSIHIEYAK